MNNSTKLKMTLFIVIFLLLVALVIYAIVGTKGEREYYSTNGSMATLEPTVTEDVNQGQYQPMQNTPPAVTIQSTPEPTLTPEPTASPTPTPEPTVEPQPQGMELAKGSFSSSDEYKLKIRADYTAVVADEDHIFVTVNVYALHYMIYYNSFKTLNICLGEDSQWLDVPNITCDSNTLTETFLNSYTFTVDAPRGYAGVLPLNVKWNYGGTYGKDASGNSIEIPSLECGGVIQYSR